MAWTETLIGAPEFEEVEAFDPEHCSLRSIRVEEWHNLIFVNLDDHAEPLAANLGGFSEQAGRHPFTKMKLFERRAYAMNCNWKTYVDNYLEGYHLPGVHPGLNRELDYGSYEVEIHSAYVRQFSPIRRLQPGDFSARRYPGGSEDLTTDYSWSFPNWMLNCYPDNVSLNVVLPLGPDRSVVIFEWYLAKDLIGSESARRAVAFSDEIQAEDAAICETVQKNLASRSYRQGRYSAKQEKGVHAFHRLYANVMTAEGAGK